MVPESCLLITRFFPCPFVAVWFQYCIYLAYSMAASAHARVLSSLFPPVRSFFLTADTMANGPSLPSACCCVIFFSMTFPIWNHSYFLHLEPVSSSSLIIVLSLFSYLSCFINFFSLLLTRGSLAILNFLCPHGLFFFFSLFLISVLYCYVL